MPLPPAAGGLEKNGTLGVRDKPEMERPQSAGRVPPTPRNSPSPSGDRWHKKNSVLAEEPAGALKAHSEVAHTDPVDASALSTILESPSMKFRRQQKRAVREDSPGVTQDDTPNESKLRRTWKLLERRLNIDPQTINQMANLLRDTQVETPGEVVYTIRVLHAALLPPMNTPHARFWAPLLQVTAEELELGTHYLRALHIGRDHPQAFFDKGPGLFFDARLFNKHTKFSLETLTWSWVIGIDASEATIAHNKLRLMVMSVFWYRLLDTCQLPEVRHDRLEPWKNRDWAVLYRAIVPDELREEDLSLFPDVWVEDKVPFWYFVKLVTRWYTAGARISALEDVMSLGSVVLLLEHMTFDLLIDACTSGPLADDGLRHLHSLHIVERAASCDLDHLVKHLVGWLLNKLSVVLGLPDADVGVRAEAEEPVEETTEPEAITDPREISTTEVDGEHDDAVSETNGNGRGKRKAYGTFDEIELPDTPSKRNRGKSNASDDGKVESSTKEKSNTTM